MTTVPISVGGSLKTRAVRRWSPDESPKRSSAWGFETLTSHGTRRRGIIPETTLNQIQALWIHAESEALEIMSDFYEELGQELLEYNDELELEEEVAR